jgi:hypothetical protein
VSSGMGRKNGGSLSCAVSEPLAARVEAASGTPRGSLLPGGGYDTVFGPVGARGAQRPLHARDFISIASSKATMRFDNGPIF